jgi:hypothetical protein
MTHRESEGGSKIFAYHAYARFYPDPDNEELPVATKFTSQFRGTRYPHAIYLVGPPRRGWLRRGRAKACQSCLRGTRRDVDTRDEVALSALVAPVWRSTRGPYLGTIDQRDPVQALIGSDRGWRGRFREPYPLR